MLIAAFWPSREGGTERQCRQLSCELARRGQSVTVITSWPGFGVRRRETQDGVAIIRCCSFRSVLNAVERIRRSVRRGRADSFPHPVLPVSAKEARRRFRIMAPFRWLDRFSFIVEAVRALKKVRPDIIHVHESHWIAGVAAWVAKQLGVPCVCKEATNPPFPAFESDVPFSELWNGKRRECDMYVALTTEAASALMAQNVSEGRIAVLPNGVQMPDLGCRKAEPHLVLCVANLTQGAHQKGFDVLIAAWSRVVQCKPGVRLVIVGGGEFAPWERSASEAGCGNSIEFAGYCRDIDAWYARTSIFVLSSRIEGMSNALLEAQSWGIPAVVTDIPGNRAVVRDGINGIVVPVGAPSRLAEGILSLLNDESRRAAMGAAARRIVEQEYSLERIVSRILDLYEDLTRGRREGVRGAICAD